MQETSLSLLTREGGLRITFRPALDDDQHAMLLEAVQQGGETIPELTILLLKLAGRWGCNVIIDPC
jgi:hypothetical protein